MPENSYILYLSVLYFFANLFLLNIKKTYERYTKPENFGFCYQPISMPNNITRQYQRRTQLSFYNDVLSQNG